MSGTKWLFRSGPQIHKMCLPTLLLISKLLEGIGNGLSLIHPQGNLKMINSRLSSSATQQVLLLLNFSRNVLVYYCYIYYCIFLGIENYTSVFMAQLTTSLVGHTLEKFPNQKSCTDKIISKTCSLVCPLLCTPFLFMNAQGHCEHTLAKGDGLHL